MEQEKLADLPDYIMQALEHFRADIEEAKDSIKLDRMDFMEGPYAKADKLRAKGLKDVPDLFYIYINKEGTGWRVLPADAINLLTKTEQKKMDRLYYLVAAEI